jgi:ribosomal protein L24
MSIIAEKYQLLLSQGIAIGTVINTEKDTPNKLGKYQEYEHGIMFYTPTFDACLLTEKVMTKWKSASVANTLTHNGSKVQDYLGFPVADTAKNNDGTEVSMFERGMIICRTDGNSFVVYGDIFTKYLSSRAKEVGSPFPNWMGYPTQDIFVGPFNGLVGKFENADIYWHPTLGAFEVHGDIRNRYNNLGQAGSLLGYPSSDEHDIVKDGVVVGRANNFQAGTIYWSGQTGAWEVHGSIGATYLKEYKGPIGDLGFPTSNETNSPSDLYRFNNFQSGILVWQKSTATVRKITKLNLLVQSIETTNDADTVSSDDPYLVINIKPSIPVNGFNPSYRLPNKSNGNDGISDGGNNQFYYDGTSNVSVQDDNKTVCSIPITDGNQKITITIETWDYDTGLNGNDDKIGYFTAVYDIDTLWDTSVQIAKDRNPNALNFNNNGGNDDNGAAKITFNFDPDDFIIDPNSVNFRRDLWWNIDNYDVERISREVYAATFSDVEQGESAFFHPFNAIFYEAVYKSLGKPGVCFGMCVEAVYALKKRSISNQPISQYNSQLINSPFGVDDKGTPFPDEARNNSFQLRHGYQLGGDLVQYYISQLFDGEIWNPVLSFNRSKEMFDRGDFPVIVMSPGALDAGHAVLPYKWDSSNPEKLIIYIADPNRPISEDKGGIPDPLSIITIYNEPGRIEFNFNLGKNNLGEDIIYSGREGSFKGGRMFPIPYSKFSTVPRTPALEIGVALLALAPLALFGGPILLPVGLLSGITGGALVLFGDTTDAKQITDGNGHNYFDENDGSVISDPDRRIDNFTHVPAFGDNAITSKPRFYMSQTPVDNSPIYSSEAEDTALSSDRWSYSHLTTAVNSKNFWAATNIDNVGQQFEPKIAENVLGLIQQTAGKGTLNFDIANKGNEDCVWTLTTRHAKFRIDTNSVADSADKITIEGINTSGQALTFMPNNAVEGKKIKTSITNHNNNLMFVFDNITANAGEPVTFQHSNGGKKVMVYSGNNPINADVSLFYKPNEISTSIQLGNTQIDSNSITTFEAISPTAIKKEVYTELGGEPKSTVSYGNIGLDCTNLAHEWLILINKTGVVVPSPTDPSEQGWFRAHDRVVNFLLEDGTYNVTLQSGNLSIVNFTVKDGIISYEAELEGIVSGAGTSILILNGLPLTIDATEVSEKFIVYLPSVYGSDSFDTNDKSRRFFTGNFLPNCHDSSDVMDGNTGLSLTRA